MPILYDTFLLASNGLISTTGFVCIYCLFAAFGVRCYWDDLWVMLKEIFFFLKSGSCNSCNLWIFNTSNISLSYLFSLACPLIQFTKKIESHFLCSSFTEFYCQDDVCGSVWTWGVSIGEGCFFCFAWVKVRFINNSNNHLDLDSRNWQNCFGHITLR